MAFPKLKMELTDFVERSGVAAFIKCRAKTISFDPRNGKPSEVIIIRNSANEVSS